MPGSFLCGRQGDAVLCDEGNVGDEGCRHDEEGHECEQEEDEFVDDGSGSETNEEIALPVEKDEGKEPKHDCYVHKAKGCNVSRTICKYSGMCWP